MGRESRQRIDAVVIALWSIAGAMTVLLAVFLWHTSPRRRLRLARNREAQLWRVANEPEPEEPDSSEQAEPDEPESGSAGSGRRRRLWPRLIHSLGLD